MEATPSSVSYDNINERVKQGGHNPYHQLEEDTDVMNEDEFQVALESIIVNFEANYKKNNTFNLKSKVQIAKLGSSLLSSIEEGRLEFEDLYMVMTSDRLFLFDIAERRKSAPIKLQFCARLSRKGDQDLNSKLYVSRKNYENDLGFFLLFCEQEYTGHSLSWI